ncbi:MAG: iron uptake porin [Potamolinea sp.]
MQNILLSTLQISLAGWVNILLICSITHAETTVATSETINVESSVDLAESNQNTQENVLVKQVNLAFESPEKTNFVAQVESVDQLPEQSDAMEQITNVSQLRDVSPGDWAYEALRSLVERYGCIAGYPDRTYRGNRATSRYEFAAGLNACLQQIEKLIATTSANLVTKEDLAKLQQLTNEFRTELTTLGTRLDTLQGRVASLENKQFSTTTKLKVELINYLGDAFGENADKINNTSLGYRMRMDFDTSFTGKDRLRTRLQSTNLRLLDTGAKFGGSPDVAIGGVSNETRFTPSSPRENGEMKISRLEYRFPVGDKLTVYLEANTIDPTIITDPITPFSDTAITGISNFSQVNPAYVPIGNRAEIAANYAISKSLSFDFGYLGEDTSGEGAPNNSGQDSGIFNGGYSAFAQLVYSSDRLKVGLSYVNSYSPANGVDTLAGSNAAKVIDVNTFSNPVVGNSYGLQANYRLSNRFELGGWVGYTAARTLGDVKGDASIFNFAVTMAFPDLGKEGNLGGIVFGMQPKLTSTSNSALASAIGLPAGQRSDRDTGFHVEAFYRYKLTDNISITPGFFWLTAPNHDQRNPDVVIGVVRTSFTF